MPLRWNFSVLSAVIAVLFCSFRLRAEETGSRAPSNVLNPNLSVIADMVGLAGPHRDGDANKLSLREVELGLQAVVDPYARADFFIGGLDDQGHPPELEEGYVTLLALPGGFQARGGKFKAWFGRLNTVHGHERPQVDSPFVLDQFLGEEGLADTGVEVSHLFAPWGLFTEVTYAVLNGLGESPAEDAQIVLVNGTDAGGNPVTVPVEVHQDESNAPRTPRNFAQVARIRGYGDLSDTANMEVGLSGALHQPENAKQVTMAALDMTVRWKPLAQGVYRSFIWRSEALYSSRKLTEETDLTGAVTAPVRRMDRMGAYSYAELQTAQRWRVGVRGDYSEDPEARGEIFILDDGSTRQVDKSITRGISPYITFTLTEFNRFRLEYQHKVLPSGEPEDRGFFQWTIVLGPHGAHPF